MKVVLVLVVGVLAHGAHSLRLLSPLKPTARPARTTSVLMKGAEPYEYSFLSVQPTYNIVDWAAAQPLLDAYIGQAKKDSDALMFCGYDTTRSLRSTTTVGGYAVVPGDKIFLRLAFGSADGFLPHLKSVLEPLHEQLQAGPATLDALHLHGPTTALERSQTALGASAIGSDVVESFAIESGLSRIEKEVGGMPLPLQLLNVHTTYAIQDAAAAKLLCDEIVQKSATEDNCLYCGFTSDGKSLHLREAFGSVIGVARHVENVGDALDALGDGPASLVETRLHCPLNTLRGFDEYIEDTARETGYCSRASTRYYTESGFSRYEVQQSLFGFFLKR